jgi:dTDP-glucose 4,6-dehydratase
MRKFSCILVTGGAGFIGSNFIRFLLGRAEFRGTVVNLDALTYAGNLESLTDVASEHSGKRYFFVKADVRDSAAVGKVFANHAPDAVVHFAAETHVDRSIISPEDFVRTNVLGTFNVLEAARRSWGGRKDTLFHHVSTDEVYGSLGPDESSSERSPYYPRSPYSASKAGSDHLVMAWRATYGLPITLSNCSNNYGPYQLPDKLVPLVIRNMQEGKALPLYGDGKNIRDWLYVEDHASAVWKVMTEGKIGQKYNVGGGNQWENMRVVSALRDAMARRTGKSPSAYEKLITYVADRPGHDRRYAIDWSKIKNELGWMPSVTLEEGLDRTVAWYLEHLDWVNHVRLSQEK